MIKYHGTIEMRIPNKQKERKHLYGLSKQKTNLFVKKFTYSLYYLFRILEVRWKSKPFIKTLDINGCLHFKSEKRFIVSNYVVCKKHPKAVVRINGLLVAFKKVKRSFLHN